MGEIPERRNAEREVRIVGEDRLARRRVAPVDRPGVGADALAVGPEPAIEQIRRGEHALQSLGDALDFTRSDLHRCGGGRRRDRWLESRIADCAALDDRAVTVVGIRREDLLGLVHGRRRGQHDPVDLVGHVAPQVPRKRLEPRDRISGSPLLDRVRRIGETEHGVLQADVRLGSVSEVGVDTCRI